MRWPQEFTKQEQKPYVKSNGFSFGGSSELFSFWGLLVLLLLLTSLWEPQVVAAAFTLAGKAMWIYFVWRLSRFLEQPVWLTVVYCLLTPFSVLYVIPFGGLALALRNAWKSRRGQDRQQSPAGTGGASSARPEPRSGESIPRPQEPLSTRRKSTS